jgi:polyphosphate kinase
MDESKYINREISWLSFNERVLQESLDHTVPLLERLRFLGIFSNNLDEFFRVRVGSLNRTIGLGKKLGTKPKKTLREIYERLAVQQEKFTESYRQIKESLAHNAIIFKDEVTINKEQEEYLLKHFRVDIQQFITPIILEDGKKFPILKDKSIYLAVKMSDRDRKKVKYALVEVPTDFIPRFIVLPKEKGNNCVIMLDDVIRKFLNNIFYIFRYEYIEAYTIKITRDAELDIDNDVSRSVIEKVASSLKQRKKGKPVRFICDKHIPDDLLSFIVKRNEIAKSNIIKSGRYHNFKDFIKFPDFGMDHLKYQKRSQIFKPEFDEAESLFKAVTKQDLFVHYPYHSFDYFVDFLREAAIDPKVESIKISLYRLANKSQVVNTLISAVKNGKKVLVVLELTARFDEEANIEWAKQMQDEGIRIIYGIDGLKVHSKLCLITKKNKGKESYYTYISTGNFNEQTSEIYNDIAVFTHHKEIGKEAEKVFHFLEHNKNLNNYQHLIVSPFNTRQKFLELIQREILFGKAGRKAEIILKMNSLVDPELIEKLYEANKYGVKVKLIVRGVCCLIPGIKGMSENIEVISIVDKYLEHARIYYFYNGGRNKLFISSADMMQRNIDYRVEVTFPVHSRKIQLALKKILTIQLADNVKARLLTRDLDNKYKTARKGSQIRSQDALYDIYLKQI